MITFLEINKLILPLNIGATTHERSAPQEIELNLCIIFASTPQACHSDNISDAICYANLTDLIRKFCLNREFHLIEHLGFSLHQYIKTLLSVDDQLKLQILKHPQDIKANCCFTVAD